MVRKHYLIEGSVQGVGFRYFVQAQARALGLLGWVRNLCDGRVEALAIGATAALAEFEGHLHRGPSRSKVVSVKAAVREKDGPELEGFEQETFSIQPDGGVPWFAKK